MKHNFPNYQNWCFRHWAIVSLLGTLFITNFSCDRRKSVNDSTTITTDLLIVGGTESGWAAAIQAARMNVKSITIVHDGEWLGGQYTEQALACVDENKGIGEVGWGVDWHPMKRSFHRSGLFKELMDNIEEFNQTKYGSKMPGRPFHGPSTFRPVEAAAIFQQMLQPYIDSGQVKLYKYYFPIEVQSSGNQVSQVCFRSMKPGSPDLEIKSQMTIDASDWGEVIQLSGAAFECGPDPKSRYNEAGAPEDLSVHPPNEMNPITWAMIIEEAETDTPIPKPPKYDDRNYVRSSQISLNAMSNLQWDRDPSLGSIVHWPDKGKESPRQLSIYNVRRIVDGYTSKEGETFILLNYMLGQDYPLERLPQHVKDALEKTEPGASEKNIVTMTREQRDIVFTDAKHHALGLLFHLQTFVHDRAPDKTNSFRHFRLSEEFGTKDHLPYKPYIRESLRLKAMYMMREDDCLNTDGPTKNEAREAFAKIMYPDGVLAWQFHYDFHRTGRTYLETEGTSGPWIDLEKGERHTHSLSDRSVFPLRSLIPEKMDGLIGAQKNLGYSSIVSAAIRLHDQCVHIGQAAGATAAVSIQHNIQPKTIPFDRPKLEEIRHALCGGSSGLPLLLWPFRDMQTDHKAFVAINRLAANGLLPLNRRDIDFQPDAEATSIWQHQVLDLCQSWVEDWPTHLEKISEGGNITRGEFALKIWNELKDQPAPKWIGKQSGDADADGIPDREDALLFNANSDSWLTN